MSGPSSLFADGFVSDAYSIPHNNVLHFPPPKGPENTIPNYAHASEVSFVHWSKICILQYDLSFSLFLRTLLLCYLLPQPPMTPYCDLEMQHMHLYTRSIYKQSASYRHKGMLSPPAQHICAYTSWFYSRNLTTQLQDVINSLASQRPHVLSTHDTAPSPKQENSDSLVVPDQPQPLDEEDYPEVLYWQEELWAKHTEEQKERGQNPPRLGFLTDDDGNPVPESRIKFFMATAKQAWNELYRLRLDPVSWTKKTPKAASYLAYHLKKNFDEFRYCHGDWKVERFAIVKYPDWCRDSREPGRLTRASKIRFICFLLSSNRVHLRC
jgi:hypothetical protein